MEDEFDMETVNVGDVSSTGTSVRASTSYPLPPQLEDSSDEDDDNENDNNRLAGQVRPTVSTDHHDQDHDTGDAQREGNNDADAEMNDVHDDNDDITNEDETETVVAHIRGTDIHVPTAAKTFLNFIRTFRSLEHSHKVQQQAKRTQRQRRDDGMDVDVEDLGDVDVDSDEDSDDDSDDDTIPGTAGTGTGSRSTPASASTSPLYLTKLRHILHRTIGLPIPMETTGTGSNPSNVSNDSNSNNNLTKSFEIDMMHIYYHNAECQSLYSQIIQHPMELIPLMDLLLQQELERLLNNINNTGNDEGVNTNDEDIIPPETYAHLNIDMENIVIPRIQVRPHNLKIVSNLRQLDPICMDTLICCKGMIVRCSSIIPDLKVAHFACTICGTAITVTIDRGRIAEPNNARCTTCQTKASYQLQHNRSIFADKQLIRLQETPDEVPAGQTPASVVTFCFDDLVDAVVPGDKVEITGILRAQPIRVHPRISKVKSIYKTYIDVIHFHKISGMQQQSKDKEHHINDIATSTTTNRSDTGNRNMNQDSRVQNSAQWTAQRIEQLKQLSQDPNIYEMLTQSLAPSIWELDNCKKGILCMLFGGNTIRVPRGTAALRQSQHQSTTASSSINGASWLDNDDDDDDPNNPFSASSSLDPAATPTSTSTTSKTRLNKRGDINILLCGDPGTSKSQLLSYVNKLCTRGIYTSGKGSSAVGLTASVVRDPETRDFALESGALVLSDLGICCIDEFDKMSDSTRSVLHEAMEQQTVSIAKAGIIATLHARTSVLASANPIESRYNPNRSVVDNIQLPPTLLSRFDLIYLILDAPNVEHDRRLAQHLVGLYYETPNVIEPPMDQALLRDYIEYARQNIHPEISDEAASQLIESYLEMRNPTGGASNGTRTISATARQLESLIRLSEALAKMRYSSIVTRNDAKEAIRLMKVATQAAATDPRTGKIDMDMITTGRSSNTREMEEQLDMTLQELFRERRGTRMAVRDVTKQLNEINNATLPHEDLIDGLRRMHADGIIQFNERTQTIFVRATI